MLKFLNEQNDVTKNIQDAGCMNIKSLDESLSSKWTYGRPSGPSWIDNPLMERQSKKTINGKFWSR